MDTNESGDTGIFWGEGGMERERGEIVHREF